jgi:Cytochrome c7 and related cytochrome c
MATALHHPLKLGRALGAALATRALLLLALLMLSPVALGAAPARPSFDHTTTGFELLGRHRDLPCESCHANAVFKGTPKDCSACHGVGTVIRATAKPTSHILSTDNCAACHSEIAWSPAVTFDHTQSRGSCSTCHNGVQAQGKPPTHIVTDLECDACHTTLTWAGAVFTHQGVTGNCAECHNGTAATGMPANHIPVGATPCEGCHSPTNFVTFAGTKINHPAVTALTCASCHETAAYLGMHPSTNTTAADSRPNATLDRNHPVSGDCGQCHDTTTFANSALRPANHIPTSAPCVQCHTTTGNYALYSVTGVHQGVTACLSCHAPNVGPFANVTMVTTPGNHIPIGSLDCSGSGCHTTKNVNAGGFKLGSASINAPTLSVAGHSTVAAAVAACQSCHESASYLGMVASTATTAGDSRPTAFDKAHPASGDCNGCHTTTPTFTSNVTQSAKPANHIPTTAACTQCHTTANNYALYSITGVHQGVTSCLSCHAPNVGPFANVTMVTTTANHIPIGSLDCNGSGCHTAANVNPGGFKLGSANINAPTLNAAGHTTISAVIGTCATCHETAPYTGMLASSASAAADSRPTAFDAKHPATGDCGNCHVTTPVFATNLLPTATKPANHIPTTAVCAQCHTTAGNFAVYSVTGVHQGVTACLTCHAPNVGPFLNVTMVTTPANHIPIGSLDCSGSGCHTTKNVNAGGFKLGSASINAPTLTVAGHTTVAAAVSSCQTCHESAAYAGMLASTATAAGDSRPTAFDKAHPTSGDCNGCHTTTPTFAGNASQGGKPANHIPTSAPCAQCHTTAGNYALYSVTGTHQGVTACLTCHAPAVAGTFANIKIVSTTGSHFPIGSLDCNGSGCHTTTNVNAGGFKLGSANINTPTLTAAGHTTIGSVIGTCATCHETAPYTGMLASTASAAADSRPVAFDAKHPATGDCGNCHVTTPVFATNLLPTATKPANHIPTTAVCSQCHTTAGNFAVYSVTGVHQGVTGCLTCHGSKVANTFVNVTIVSTPANHIPIGSLDCNGSGCHTTKNVNAGGFKLGSASINAPTLTVAGHTTVAAAVSSCQTCHESAAYAGMLASSATAAGDSRPTAFDKSHPTSGDCNGCHTTTPTFTTNVSQTAKPANHIPTTAACTQCHTTANNYALYSVTGTHQGVTACLTCHAPAVAGTFANIKIVTTTGSHFPIGSLDCNGSGCHTTTNVNAGGFKLGSANINTPTLNAAGHTTIGSVIGTCATCHETAPYTGMLASTATAAGDSRPTAFDAKHPATGDCGNCHVTTPVFATNLLPTATKPANHIPTTAVCSQCHTTAGNFAVYSVTGVHQGITGCLTCHGSKVANTFLNVTMVTTPANHIPIGSLDCNGSGCHTTKNVNAGGFKLGSANINVPTLTVAGHTTVAAAVSSCQTCHEGAAYAGMLASTATAAGDSRPTAFDKAHPTSGDCNGCHTTTPTFTTNQSGGSTKPANHIPTTAACAQCHTTAGNYALYSVTGTHQGVTACLTCHASSVAGTFANIKIVSTPSNHFPIGTLDCNGSGCHTTTNVNAGGFKLGSANINTPTLTVAGHTTVAKAVSGCQTCHETAAYAGMLASTATAAGDSRPTAFDKSHPTSGDCNGCHTTTPTFTSNVTAATKPANHIPTTAACAQCHTTAGNYALYVMGATGHKGITSNCAQCHAYGLSFYNMAPPTLVQPPSGTTGHIPAVPPNGTASIACELCHSPAAFTTFSGTVMKHAYVTSMKCMSCHEYGMQWKTNSGQRLWVRDSPNHHAGQDCGGSGCHSSRDKLAIRPARATATTTGTLARATTGSVTRATTGTVSVPSGAQAHAGPGRTLQGPSDGSPPAAPLPAAPFAHAGVAGTACVSCHSAASGAGKPASHLSTTDSCQSCHSTLAWLPVARVDHSQVRGTCVSCHNGVTAPGKPAKHLPTTAACDSCHTTNAWTPARFDHAAVAPHTCVSCHNAVRAIGLPRSHIPTTQSCDACHGTLGWKPAKVDHTAFVSGCAACHNNAGAVGIPAGHLRVSRDCSSCHSYPEWSAVRFRHTSAAYPGDHRVALTCSSCHTSETEAVPYPSPANAGTCAGCHAKDFKPAQHPKVLKGADYTVSELANCSGACHVYSDASDTKVGKSQPGPYHRVTDATFKH